jgi:hypothetical protein
MLLDDPIKTLILINNSKSKLSSHCRPVELFSSYVSKKIENGSGTDVRSG